LVRRGSVWRACFHARPADWLIDRPRVVRIHPGSVFHQADSPSELLRLSPCVALSRAAATYLGSCPLLDIIMSLPLSRDAHRLAGAISVFSTVGLLLQPDLRACFIPQPSPGLSLVQGFVHPAQPSTVILPVPPMSLSVRTLTCKQAATYEHLDSDVLLHTRPLATSSVFSLPCGRSPLRVQCSSRSP